MKEWNDWTKKELLSLPVRKWDLESSYRSVLFVNTRTKHPSGYNLFAIVGCDDNCVPKEICGYMDDFMLDNIGRNWKSPIVLRPYEIAFDCSMHGVFRLWCRYYEIVVGHNVSTTKFSFRESPFHFRKDEK